MEATRFAFYTDDSDPLSADELAFGAFRWFMNFAELNKPEFSAFYPNAKVKTFGAKDFFPFPSPQIEPEKALTFILVGGLDESDYDRIVVSYMIGSKLLNVQFPGLSKLTTKAKRVMKRFRNAMPLPEIEVEDEQELEHS